LWFSDYERICGVPDISEVLVELLTELVGGFVLH